MMTFSFVIILGLFCWYVLSPLFTGAYKNKKWDFGSAEKENLLMRKQEIVAAINDLEYDVKLKKMNAADYQQIKEKLVREGAAVLEALYKLESARSNSSPKTKHRSAKKAVA